MKKNEIVIEHVATEEMCSGHSNQRTFNSKHEKCIQGFGMRRDGVNCAYKVVVVFWSCVHLFHPLHTFRLST